VSGKPSNARRETLAGLFAIWLGMVGVCLCLGGILIFGWQAYVWVKFGTRLPKPLLGMVLDLVHPDTSWLTHPHAFFLLHSVVVGTLGLIPLSGCLIGFGLLLILAGYRIGGAPPANSGTKAPEPHDAHLHGRNGHG